MWVNNQVRQREDGMVEVTVVAMDVVAEVLLTFALEVLH
jgi:hypothetical protein